MIEGPAITSIFGFCFNCSACSNGIENAKLASPVCMTVARVLLSTTGFQVRESTFGRPFFQ